MHIPCYDAEIIRQTASESGFTLEYVSSNEESKNQYYENDDRLFVAESKVIKRMAKEPCVIVGRCADYVLKDKSNVIKVFLYSDDVSKKKRVTKYYGVKSESAQNEIDKINKARSKHYKYYTNREWKNFDNYDVIINVDKYGVEKTTDILESLVKKS